jgi:hypothetical protein
MAMRLISERHVPASLDLHYVDELIAVRAAQHGGKPGAPLMVAGYRVGESLNRSCMVMLSALLQAFVEEVFISASRKALRSLKDADTIKKYKDTIRRWGNPAPQNIDSLFARIGIPDPIGGLSWKNCKTATIRNKLDEMNQIRNDIAHGETEIKVNGVVISLSLARVKNYRDFTDQFSTRFETHVSSTVKR